MVTLSTYDEFRKYAYEELLRTLGIVQDSFILSSIGARICYSSSPPIELIKSDKRITDLNERRKFLTRISKANHFSVFAHSPVKIFGMGLKYLPYLYKVFHLPPDKWCINARHLVEAGSCLGINILENLDYIGSNIRAITDIWHFVYHGIEYTKGRCTILHYSDFDEFLSNAKDGSPEIIIFKIEYPDWEWYSVIVHGFSTCFSHQFVRHTWLNFSQRSHRYTEVDDYVYPPSALQKITIRDKEVEAKMFFDEQYGNSSAMYRILVDAGVPKEDVRYISPRGSATTIMASGPRFVWEDFVSKRNHPKAQYEIRLVAKAISEVLSVNESLED